MATDRQVAVIQIREGKELKNTQFLGKQSPYVVVCLASNPSREVKTSSQVNGGDSGKWNETKILEIENQNDCLLFSVMNENKNAVIGRLRVACSELSSTPVEKMYEIYDSSGTSSGKLLMSLSRTDSDSANTFLQQAQQKNTQAAAAVVNSPPSPVSNHSQPAPVSNYSQPPTSIGGFSQPQSSGYLNQQQPVQMARPVSVNYPTTQPTVVGGFNRPVSQNYAAQPTVIGGFTQPAPIGGFSQPTAIGGFTQPAAIIGGFSQPYTSGPTTTIGGFQQPSTADPINSIGGFTVAGSTAGGYTQTQCAISGAATGINLPSNSNGMLSRSIQQPNVTVRGEYQPQTDTANGGRLLYPPQPIPVVAAPAAYASPPIAQVQSYQAYVPPQQQPYAPQQQAYVPHQQAVQPTGFQQQQQQQVYSPYLSAPVAPVAPVAPSPSSPQLPPGWELRYTPEGKPYYLNHNDRTTSWTPPK